MQDLPDVLHVGQNQRPLEKWSPNIPANAVIKPFSGLEANDRVDNSSRIDRGAPCNHRKNHSIFLTVVAVEQVGKKTTVHSTYKTKIHIPGFSALLPMFNIPPADQEPIGVYK